MSVADRESLRDKVSRVLKGADIGEDKHVLGNPIP
jgi:hypothetical protein